MHVLTLHQLKLEDGDWQKCPVHIELPCQGLMWGSILFPPNEKPVKTWVHRPGDAEVYQVIESSHAIANRIRKMPR